MNSNDRASARNQLETDMNYFETKATSIGDNPPALKSVTNTEKTLGVGRTKIYELINSGELKSVKIGAKRLIVVDSIND
jgi:excisionase family DNA binding protein